MKTLAVYSLKGGVGKTVTAVNLAHLAALHGHRVLLWDLDAQGAASWYLRTKPKLKGGVKKLVNNKTPIGELVKPTRHRHIDILPADFSNRHLDVLLDARKRSKSRLARLIDPFSQTHSLVILDCAPSISLVSDNVFRAASLITVPIIPTPQILHVYERLQKYLAKQKLKRTKLRAFLSMVDRRRGLHRELLQSLPTSLDTLLDAYIPYSAAVEKMNIKRAPLTEFNMSSEAAKQFLRLWLELDRLL